MANHAVTGECKQCGKTREMYGNGICRVCYYRIPLKAPEEKMVVDIPIRQSRIPKLMKLAAMGHELFQCGDTAMGRKKKNQPEPCPIPELLRCVFCRGRGITDESRECRPCQGTGIDDERIPYYEQAGDLKRRRLKYRLDETTLANRLGISVTQYARLESGYQDPKDLEYSWGQLLLGKWGKTW